MTAYGEILSIDEHNEGRNISPYIGYDVVTTTGTIKIRIDNHSWCCESWGISKNDTEQSFIGATITEITYEYVENTYDEMYKLELYIETDRGLLTLTAWNEHNGYYSHDAFVQYGEVYKNYRL